MDTESATVQEQSAKTILAEELSKRLALPIKGAQRTISITFTTLLELTKEKGEVSVYGFGTFRNVKDELNPTGYLEFEPAAKCAKRQRRRRGTAKRTKKQITETTACQQKEAEENS